MEPRSYQTEAAEWVLTKKHPVYCLPMGTSKPPEGERGFHASGRITGPDVLELIEIIDPKFIIRFTLRVKGPWKGTSRHGSCASLAKELRLCFEPFCGETLG